MLVLRPQLLQLLRELLDLLLEPAGVAQRIAQHEEAERKRHEGEKAARQAAAKNNNGGNGAQSRVKVETKEEKADRIAKELMADEDNEKKKMNARRKKGKKGKKT